MGRRSGRHRCATYDSDDNVGTASSNGGSKTMDHFLDNLFEKRGSTRESALTSIVEGFTVNCQHHFAEKNFATLLYRCLNSFKKGSSKESCLASHALGLLAITIGCGDNAHELYEESLPPLSHALKSGSESVKLTSILDCLAIVTFVGGSNSEETERSMQIIWHFIHSESGCNVVARKHSSAVQSAAISAWSLLLTTMDGWTVDYNYWQGAISFFLDLLEAGDEPVCVATGEALALIFEVGCLEKFATDTKGTSDSSVDKGNNLLNGFPSIQELKEKILSRVRILSVQANIESLVNKAVNGKCNSKWDVLKVLEDGCFPETSAKIGKQNLKLYTWSQLLQLNFLKRLLGGGFVRHMLENELLHDVFSFTPKTQQSGKELYVSEREEVFVRLFVPEVRKKDCQDRSQRIYKSPNSIFRKAKTQLLNKQRVIRADWWIAFGDEAPELRNFADEAPELRNFAVKILSLTCSSSACNRNWSTFSKIHTKRRNRLFASRLNSLAYIMYNKKLKDRHIKKKALTEEEDSLVVDSVPFDSEWVAGENDKISRE